MSDQERQHLLDTLACEEARLRALDEEREKAAASIAALKARLEERAPVSTPSLLAPSEKVALFRNLFRGREDIYARLWTNRKTGKKGYAPACASEWVQGVCEKPRVKCGECPSKAFLPMNAQTVLDHLQGRHVMGLYPLLADETCRILAADFDEASWQDDVSAFAETCRMFGIEPALERSRSGNGAHVWFFFSGAVSAATARKMGCFLLTETMARRHELGMESYDRLFPNQDTMPKGGFGNLIALPLQHEARERGNTEFLDGNLVPHADQWAYLASIRPLAPSFVEQLVREAVRTSRILGVRSAEFEGEGSERPWERPPPAGASARIAGPLPSQVKAVLAQRIYIEKEGLPSSLLTAIKRLAAFQNPEFYKKERMRFSTALTPRVIRCFEDHPRHLALPRGCLDDLRDLLEKHSVELILDDKRESGSAVDFGFHGELSAAQKEAVDTVIQHDFGILSAPPGSGKTIMGASLIAARARNTLVLVHRKPLMDQWVAQLSSLFGIEPKSIGRIGAGRKKATGRLDVAMIQSLVRKGEVSELIGRYGHLVVDECHHVPAVSFEKVLAEAGARFITGLTATPYRRDGHHPILHMQCGPVRFSLKAVGGASGGAIAKHLIVRETEFRLESEPVPIQSVYAALATDGRRNTLIVDDVMSALEEGRSPLVLTERKDHLDLLAGEFERKVARIIVLRGGLGTKKHRAELAKLTATPEGEPRLVLAIGRYIGEGFDDPRLDTLFLAMPISWKGTLVQYAGRLNRAHADKVEVRIYDYVDRQVPVLARMSEKRMQGYRALGYESPNLRIGI